MHKFCSLTKLSSCKSSVVTFLNYFKRNYATTLGRKKHEKIMKMTRECQSRAEIQEHSVLRSCAEARNWRKNPKRKWWDVQERAPCPPCRALVHCGWGRRASPPPPTSGFADVRRIRQHASHREADCCASAIWHRQEGHPIRHQRRRDN
jgi:hypothetical protein